MIGFSYDANGNMLSAPNVSGLSYDVENRLVTAGGDSYAYSPNGKRIWKMMPSGTQEFYFYSISGQKLGTYVGANTSGGYTAMALDANVYFGSRMIVSRGNVVARCSGAHTGPVYVRVGNEPFWKRKALRELIQARLNELQDVEALAKRGVPTGREGGWDNPEGFRNQVPALLDRVEAARKIYLDMLDRSKQSEKAGQQ